MIKSIINYTSIDLVLLRALATGDFGINNPHSTKVGVAQVLNRLTYISSLSHLRRVNTPIDNLKGTVLTAVVKCNVILLSLIHI